MLYSYLPAEPFAYAVTYPRTVSRDCFASFEGNAYSAPAAFAGKAVKLKATPAEVQIYSPAGALLVSRPRRLRGAGERLIRPEHWEGLPGAAEAIANLEKLAEMGLSPFLVERRELSVYEEVAGGDTR